jgi:triphosphatase
MKERRLADEVELKLELDSGAADALEQSGLLEGAPKVVQQRSIYFDTPDHHLSAAGFSLRIRHAGRTRIQTVKVNGGSAAGLFARQEWERNVKDDTPVLDESTPIASLLGERMHEIVPAFEVHVERQTWNIINDDASIEVALDRGKVVAGDRQTLICEVELEQKGGSLAALFALGRKIDAIAPVRLGVLSKSERGYRLLGPFARSVETAPVALKPEMTAATAFQHIVRACVRQFRLNEALLLEQRDADALHHARVALRRLRSAFAIHAPMLGGVHFKQLHEQLRWIPSELGEARNLDVLIEHAETGPLRAGLEQARSEAFAAVEVTLASQRARTLMIDLAEWITNGDWLGRPGNQEIRNLPARAFAAEALDRFHKKVKKRGHHVAKLDDQARHEVRKAAKNLRYAAEFFAALYQRKQDHRRHKRFVATLSELQDQLGALNDLATAPEVLDKLGLTNGPGAASLHSHNRKEKLLNAAAKAHLALVEADLFWR